MKAGKAFLLTVLILAIYLLHQDFWNWKKTEPLVLGFLPIGLAYHAGYSILAAILMAVLVKVAWPKHLENSQSEQPGRQSDDSQGH
jgi:hypothetical protein